MTEQPKPTRRTFPWQVLLLGAAALALALVIGTQVIGVLYGIFVPPPPPLPEEINLMRHNQGDYGVDEWVYSTNRHVCEIVEYYEEQGAYCRVLMANCSAAITANAYSLSKEPQHIAQCVGNMHFSIFAMRYRVIMSIGYPSGDQTRFRLSREIYWTGAVPPLPEL